MKQTAQIKKNNNGFTIIEVVIIVAVVIAIGLTALFVLRSHSKAPVKTVSAVATKPLAQKTSATKPISSTSSSPTTAKTDTKISTPTTTKTTTSTPSTNDKSTTQPSSSSPTITITSPTNGQVLTSSQYTYSCSFITSTGTGTVTESAKNSAGQVVDSATFNDITSNNCYEQSENTYNAYPNGNYTITFTVTDSEGRTATATNQFTWDQ